MKKIISAILASLMLLSAASCGKISPETSATATASASEQFLIDRLGSADGFVLGTDADAAAYGIDMTDFRDEGYVIRSEGAETLIFGKTEDGLDRAVRYYVKNCKDGGVINVTYGEGYRVKQITIAGRDISEYSIYLFEGADECHNIAAAELQKYIALACGVTMPIVRTPAEHNIVLERVGEDDPRSETLYREGFNISVRDDGELYISGGYDRGCLYGVYELLEAYIGWRFVVNGEVVKTDLTDDDYYLYEAELIDIPAGLVDEQVPSFDYRQGRFYDNLYSSDLPVILRENDKIRGSATYNGYGYTRGACHGLLSGPIKAGYVDSVVAKEVIKGSVQPCFTDEDFIEACIWYYTDYIEARLAAGQQIGRELTHIDIAQNDTTVFCECKNCMEKVALDGHGIGPMLYFSNTLAKHFGEEYPGLYLSILVYFGTTKPPAVTMPEPNLNCSFCFFGDTDCDFCTNHCLNAEECDPLSLVSNTKYAERFEKWCEIAEMVTVWYYPGHWEYGNLSMNVLDQIRADFAYFKEMGIHGVYPCMQSAWNWDSQDWLMPYLMDKLMWNADMTDEEYWELIYEYLCLFYGEDSAPYLMEYIEWSETVERDNCYTLVLESLPNERIDFLEVAAARDYILGLMDLAMENAATAEIEKAIILFSRPLYNTILIAGHSSMYIDGTEEERAEYTELFNEFKEIALTYGFYFHTNRASEDDFDIEKNLGWAYNTSQYFTPNWWPQPQSVLNPDNGE